MAVVIVATPGGTTANSYCTQAEATTYHEGHLYSSTWDDATADEKNRALVMATALLDEWYAWEGYATNADQALQWPRTGVMDALYRNYIDSGVVPQKLKDATAELARQVLGKDLTADSDIETQGVTAMSAGSVSFSFRDDVKAVVMPGRIRSMLPKWWGVYRGASGWLPAVRS